MRFGVAALANNAPVSYGALGAPILGLAAVTGLPLLGLSASIGNIVAVLALLAALGADLPGERLGRNGGSVAAGDRGVASYILGQWPVAHYLGPYLPDLSGALVSFWVLFLFVKVWRPKTIRGFRRQAAAAELPRRRNLEMASACARHCVLDPVHRDDHRW